MSSSNEFSYWGNFVNVIKNNYVNFSGRSSRKEFWSFILVYLIIYTIIAIILQMLDLPYALMSVYSLLLFLPYFALAVRRLHDVNKSGWNVLWSLIPLIGLYLIYLVLQPTGTEPNQYGDPVA